jgi:proline iminopeptidase
MQIGGLEQGCRLLLVPGIEGAGLSTGRPAERAFTASVPAGVIAASQTASGPPVLILHGGPGWSDYTASLAAELEDAFCVIRFQQRGLEPSTTAGPFDVERHVADAIAVLDAAGAGQAYVIGHSWGGHLAMHLAARHQDRLLGLVAVDPLGAVPDGGLSDLGRILTERMSPAQTARAQQLQERSQAGEATMEDALEGLTLVWPGYFAAPDKAPPMPPLRLSPECFAGTFASIRSHFEHQTLVRLLPALTIPAVFVLGAASPIPPHHGVASAALIPGARYIIEDDCGHFPWLERPGVVRRALDSILSD